MTTKDEHVKPLPLSRIAEYVADFLDTVRAHPNLIFDVTNIGCGIADYNETQIAPLFQNAPSNCLLPEGWRNE